MKKRLMATTVLTLASLWLTARADILTGLQTYWRFDDGSGSSTARDFTGYGNQGTLVNFADATYTSMWTDGQIGKAVLFNADGATTNYVSIPDSTNVNFAVSRAFTLSAWVKLSVDGTAQTNGAAILCKGITGKESYSLDVNNGKFRVLMRNTSGGSQETASSTTLPVAGVWYHVVGVFNRSPHIVGIYVNGVFESQSGGTLTTVYLNTHPLTIGCKESTSTSGYDRPFQGVIDEVRQYNRRLPDEDVAELYAATSLNYEPIFLVQPLSGSANQDSAYTNATVVMGSETLSFKWYKDNVPQNSQTNAVLVLDPVRSSDASLNWYLVATNPYGSATSSVVSLTVSSAPVIPAPVSTNVVLFTGGKVTLSVSPAGAEPMFYQWSVDSVAIDNATNSSLTLNDTPVGYAGSFVCRVTNTVGAASSTPIRVSVIAAPTAPYPAKVLADNPLGYWRLNEPDNGLANGNAGAIAHDYWGGDDGTYTNTALAQTGYNPATDPTGTSALFGPGPDSYAGNVEKVDFGASTGSVNFSVEAWVNGPPQDVKGAGIVTKGYGNGGEQFCLDSQSPTTGLRFFVRDFAGAAHACNSTFLLDYLWHHVVGVCDESNGALSLYIDGRLAATGTITPGSGLRMATEPMVIGARTSALTSTYNNNQFNGQVAEVAIYGHALTAAQVLNHYTAAGTPPFLSQTPPATVTANEGGMLAIPATVVGTPPVTNTWRDMNAGTNVAQIVVTGTNAGDATLVVAKVPAGWNGNTLQLTAANAYGQSSSASVSLSTYSGVPVFVQNLPPTPVTVAGKTYTYSVALQGAEPFTFHWYSNNVLLADQVTSSYTFPAAAASYRVEVGNTYGSTPSTISSLATVPQLTTAYASAVLAAGAVGYWPLQETSAEAAATKEINHGTLGALGNAYYVSGNATFGTGGALTLSGSSDAAVGFAGTTDSYAFVPRIDPALTVRPPFTVECWVLPVDGNFHDILGQSGSGLNSAGGAGDWAGFRLSQGNPTDGPALQFYAAPGTGTTRNGVMTPGNSLPVGAWHHCVATYDGVNVTLYIDGQALATGPLAMAVDTWTPFTIGGSMFYNGVPQRRFNSAVDEVAVYTNLLTAQQISDHALAGVTAGANYSQAVLGASPTLYYRMNCASYTTPNPDSFPTAVNYGSAPVNGSYVAGVIPGGVPGPVMSGFDDGAAAPINGILSGIDAGYCPAFNPAGSQPVTAMTWFRSYPSDGRVQTLMSHGANWALNLDGTTGRVVWNLYGGGQVTSTNVLNDGQWHMVAGVSDGTTSSFYVDGVLNSSGAVEGPLAGDPGASLFLGGNANYTNITSGQRYFAGALAQAAFFTNALSAAKILELYQTVTVLPTPTISLGRIGANLAITYTGTLLSSTNAVGDYQPVDGASSPYIVPQTLPQMFYRTRNP